LVSVGLSTRYCSNVVRTTNVSTNLRIRVPLAPSVMLRFSNRETTERDKLDVGLVEGLILSGS